MSSSIFDNKNIIDLLFSQVRNKEVVLWAGAGFSGDAGLPSAYDLVQQLIEKFRLDRKLASSDLQDIANLIVYKNSNCKKNRNILIKQIESFLNCVTPNATHDLVSYIPYIRDIVTTNYDNLFEMSFGSNIYSIYNTQTFLGVTPDTNKVLLFKIHGDFKDYNSIVITRDDYAHFISKDNTSLIINKVKEFFATKTILFVGYSIDDVNVRSMLTWVRSVIEKSPKNHFYVAPGITQEKKNWLEDNHITYIDLTAKEIMEELFKRSKKTIIPDLEKDTLNLLQVNIATAHSGFYPSLRTNRGKMIVTGIELLDPTKDTYDNTITLSANISANKRLQDFVQGNYLGEMSFSKNEIDQIALSSLGYTIKNIYNPELFILKTLPTYEGPAFAYFENDPTPYPVLSKTYESANAFRHIVDTDYLQYDINLQKSDNSLKITITKKTPEDDIDGILMKYKKIVKFFSSRDIKISHPTGRELVIMLSSIYNNQQMIEFRLPIFEIYHLITNLMTIQRYFEVTFDILNETITDALMLNAHIISGNINHSLGASLFYGSINSQLPDSIDEPISISLNNLDNARLELCGYTFMISDWKIGRCKLKRSADPINFEGRMCYEYTSNDGFIPLECTVIKE